MNLETYCVIPRKERTSLTFSGVVVLTMVLILLGSAETPFALNTCLKKVSSFVENTHLSLLILAQLSSSLFSVARRLCLAMNTNVIREVSSTWYVA